MKIDAENGSCVIDNAGKLIRGIRKRVKWTLKMEKHMKLTQDKTERDVWTLSKTNWINRLSQDDFV